MTRSTQDKLERLREQQRAAQKRARDKAIAKRSDPEYIAKQKDKQAAARIKAQERAKAKRDNPPATKAKTKTKRSSIGMKGRTPTAAERRHMDKVAKLPCVACYLYGKITYLISLHHTNGRTAPGAHFCVLPLCENHHQIAAPAQIRKLYPWLIPIHADMAIGGKAAFAKAVGTNEELLALVARWIDGEPPEQYQCAA